MSVGLMVRLEDPPKGFLKRRRDAAKILREFARAVEQAASKVDPLLGKLVGSEEFQSGIELELLPGLEPLHLEISDGWAQVSASTSGGGPGYHVYVVELIETAATAIGVKLKLDDPKSDGAQFFDEGGFLHDRDFARLETEMGAWLQGISKLLVENDQWEDIALMWPVDRPRVPASGIVTPMGPRSKDVFLAAAQSLDAAPTLGRALLPWWDRGFDAGTALNVAMLLGWSELRWHAPANDTERRRMEQFVAAVERARELGAAGLPEREQEEARSFLQDDDNTRPPAKEGIGYFRHRVRPNGTGGWTFDVPGFWYDEWENDGETATWWFDGTTVRHTSLSADGELPVPQLPEKTPDQRAFLTLEQERMKGWAEVKSVTEDGEPYFQLAAKVVSANHLCVLTVSFTDPADQTVAEQVFRSLRPPPPAEPEK